MRKLPTIFIVGLSIIAIACGSGSESEFPKQGVIGDSAAPLGAWLLSDIEDDGRICVMPPGNRLLNSDGSDFRIPPGTRIEILEEANCTRVPRIPYKIRVVDQDIVGWIPRNSVIVTE